MSTISSSDAHAWSSGFRKGLIALLATLGLVLLVACTAKAPPEAPSIDPPTSPATTDAEELEAFTRLYGYLRYFHPSDAAAEANWGMLAIQGAEDVILGEDQRALLEALGRFTASVAPTANCYLEEHGPPALDLAGDGPSVAWQHRGLGFGDDRRVYDSLRLARPEQRPKAGVTDTFILAEQLFEARPTEDEVLQLTLGSGIRLQLPIILPDHLARQAPSFEYNQDEYSSDWTVDRPEVRAAMVVVGWSALAHFYPYFDVIDEDWDAVLRESIADVLDDVDHDDILLTLQRMVSRLHDGHGYVYSPEPLAYASIKLARVEDKVVVLAAEHPELAPGDEVVAIDSLPIEQAVAETRARLSGSPQLVEHAALGWGEITGGAVGTSATLSVRRGEDPMVVEIPRSTQPTDLPPAHAPIEVFEDGVFYIDLDQATWEIIEARIDEIAAAPGVVFDMRGYPKVASDLLRRLISAPDTSKWMFVPHVIYPHQERLGGWDEHGWDMSPAEPHIAGDIVFMAGSGTISAAESVMGLVEGYGLGEIVGAPTAGANGNINWIALPADFSIRFTGMKVTRLDGRQHHLIGVQPTIPSAPTIEGIRAGRDEVLETALSVVRGEG